MISVAVIIPQVLHALPILATDPGIVGNTQGKSGNVSAAFYSQRCKRHRRRVTGQAFSNMNVT